MNLVLAVLAITRSAAAANGTLSLAALGAAVATAAVVHGGRFDEERPGQLLAPPRIVTGRLLSRAPVPSAGRLEGTLA